MMKKIVYESLQDFKNNAINEFGEGFGEKIKQGARNIAGAAKKGYEKVSAYLRDAFKKIGSFFVAQADGELISGVLPPINIGILSDKGILQKLFPMSPAILI
ncbi:MAG: hypothetical protein HC831_17495 [Chloroflexia bacterium]|nr:hypothetical protein [Chloroflexia bacterium]